MSRHTMTRITTAAAVGLLLVGSLGATRVAAQFRGPMGPGGMGRAGMGPGAYAARRGGATAFGLRLGQLGLTEAQRDQVRTILDSHRAEQQAAREKLVAARKALDAAMTAEALNEGAIRTAYKALSDLQEDAAVQRARVRAEVWQVLTPEQRTRAKELQAQAEQRRAQRADRTRQRLERRPLRQATPKPPAL